jgi:hypothetical protein
MARCAERRLPAVRRTSRAPVRDVGRGQAVGELARRAHSARGAPRRDRSYITETVTNGTNSAETATVMTAPMLPAAR